MRDCRARARGRGRNALASVCVCVCDANTRALAVAGCDSALAITGTGKPPRTLCVWHAHITCTPYAYGYVWYICACVPCAHLMMHPFTLDLATTERSVHYTRAWGDGGAGGRRGGGGTRACTRVRSAWRACRRVLLRARWARTSVWNTQKFPQHQRDTYDCYIVVNSRDAYAYNVCSHTRASARDNGRSARSRNSRVMNERSFVYVHNRTCTTFRRVLFVCSQNGHMRA